MEKWCANGGLNNFKPEAADDQNKNAEKEPDTEQKGGRTT